MLSTRSQVLIGGLATGLMLEVACRYRDPRSHCAQDDGNAFCEREHSGDGRYFCGHGREECEPRELDGCLAERPVEDACYSPCGGGLSADEDPECEGVAEGSSSSASATATDATSEPTGGPTSAGSMSASGTEGSSSTTSSGCTESSECTDPAAPICVDMACVPCTSDDECAAKSPGAPACNEAGQCVTCTPSNASACEGVTPVCNTLNECEGCDFHEQCVGTACDIATGACFAEDCVVEVDGDGGADYQNIQAALVDGCVVLVHELNAGASYQQAVSVDGIKVAVIAAPGEEPLVQGTGGNPSLNVTNDAVVYVQGLTFTDSDVEGITADGGTLYLDRTQVVGNTGGGILLQNAAAGHLRNCFVGQNVDDVAALQVSGSTAEVVYTTLVSADEFEDAAALLCTGSDVTVRNSLIAMIGDDPEISCGGVNITYSATETLAAGEGNVALGDVMPAWFVNLTGEFHLNNPPAAVLTAAQWQAGDPLVDIDGEPRPTEPGTADVAGADLP